MSTAHKNGHKNGLRNGKVRVAIVGVGNCASSLVQGVHVELKLEVVDSPNSAGIVIDAVRCIKLALDRGIGGSLEGPSSYFMKSPPVQYSDNEARRLVEEFIEGGKPQADGRDRRVTRTRAATTTARR